jgi:hypothetical protein
VANSRSGLRQVSDSARLPRAPLRDWPQASSGPGSSCPRFREAPHLREPPYIARR